MRSFTGFFEFREREYHRHAPLNPNFLFEKTSSNDIGLHSLKRISSGML